MTIKEAKELEPGTTIYSKFSSVQNKAVIFERLLDNRRIVVRQGDKLKIRTITTLMVTKIY